MSLPNVLLLVGGPAAPLRTGNIFLSQLAEAYPNESLCRFSTIPRGPLPTDNSWLGHYVAYEIAPSLGLPIVSDLLDWKFRNFNLEAVVGSAMRFAEDQKIEMIWAVLNSSAIINVANTLVQRLKVPLVSTVWDTPDGIARVQRLGRSAESKLTRAFNESLILSRQVSVMSDPMGEAYYKEFGVKTVRMVQGVPHDCWLPSPPRAGEISKELTIGFAGSLYALREWNSLIDAISSAKGEIAGRRVQINVVGYMPRRGAKTASFVHEFPPTSMKECIEMMSRCDVCYLPYWFDPCFETEVRYSFPSKLSAYVASGTPTFFHGPEYSSPTPLFRTHRIGRCCHSLEVNDILECISDIIEDEILKLRCREDCLRLLVEQMGLDPMRRSFATLLGIDVTDLLSPPVTSALTNN